MTTFSYMLSTLLLLIASVTGNPTAVNNAIAAYIKQQVQGLPWCSDTGGSYTTYATSPSFNGAKLVEKEKRFPIKVEYTDVVGGGTVRTIYIVVKVEPNTDTPRSAKFTLIIPPLSKAETGNSATQYGEMMSVAAVEAKDLAYLVIKYEGGQYKGEGAWLSTHASVGIKPGWGHGSGAALKALRMANFVWKSFGIDVAYIHDDARFPCGSGLTISKQLAPARSSDFGRARVLRLFQGKLDQSIYQKGGYTFRPTMTVDPTTMAQVAIDLGRMRTFLLQFTAYTFVQNMGVRPGSGDARKNYDSLKSAIIGALPGSAKTGSTITNHAYLMKDVLVAMYGSGCKGYYAAMKHIAQMPVAPGASPYAGRFKNVLNYWVSATAFLDLTNIQATTFDGEFYSDVFEQYGAPTPCSFGVAVCTALGSVTVDSSSAGSRYRCKLDSTACKLKHHKVDGFCWGKTCNSVHDAQTDVYGVGTQDPSGAHGAYRNFYGYQDEYGAAYEDEDDYEVYHELQDAYRRVWEIEELQQEMRELRLLRNELSNRNKFQQ